MKIETKYIGIGEVTLPTLSGLDGINIAMVATGLKAGDVQKVSAVFQDMTAAMQDGRIDLDEGAQILLNLVDVPPMKKASFQNFISILKKDLEDNRIDGSEIPGLVVAAYMLFAGFRM